MRRAESLKEKYKRFGSGLTHQKQLDHILGQLSNPQHKEAMLKRLRPHLKFTPAPLAVSDVAAGQ